MKLLQSMPVLKWLALLGFNILTLVLLTISIQSALYDIDPNTCTMTYMLPNYYHVPTNHSMYRLFYYREGKVANPPQLTALNHKQLKGIPVLFIPGNGGSYKQIRSVGAEAHAHLHRGDRKVTETKKSNQFAVENPNKKKRAGKEKQVYHNELDIFTVDFDEELSAFGGDVMYSETAYVNECIRVILELYKKSDVKTKPTSVILIGHSMGGLVARMSLLLPNHIYGSVTTIITLNSSHRNAPIYSHSSTGTFYHELNRHWSKQIQPKHFEYDDNGELTNLPNIYDNICLISIAGGHRDTLIRSELASLDGLVAPDKSFSVVTTSIPEVLIETDHQCILWCNEVVLSLVEGLLLLGHPDTKQNTFGVYERLDIMKSVLKSNVPESLGYIAPPLPINIASLVSQTKPSATYSNHIRQHQHQPPQFDLESLTDLAKKMTFESYSLMSIINKPTISYKSNPRTRITTSISPLESYYLHFKLSDWIGDSNYFALTTSLAIGEFSVLLYSKNYEKSEEVSQKAFSLPPLPPLSQSIVETPSTQLILTHSDMKHFNSLFIAIPFSSRKHSFVLVSQFYNSTASMINIPSISIFRDYRFILPVGHPLVMNFSLPLYTNKYPIKATLQTKYLDFDNTNTVNIDTQQLAKKNFVINNIKSADQLDVVTESEDDDAGIKSKLGKQKKLFVDKESIILNNYPIFLPVSYQYIPQLMEEGKFVLNCTLTKVKFHQSSKPMYSYVKPHQHTTKNIKFVQVDSKSNSGYASDYRPVHPPSIQEQKKILYSEFDSESPATGANTNTAANTNTDIQIDNPHLFMFLDPFYSYEIAIGFDWVGSIGSLVFSYALSIIPCTFALFLWVFSYQIHSMIKKDKFPSLLTTLRDQSLVLTPFLLYFPLSLCIFFTIIGSPIPTFYHEFFPDPTLDKFMLEQIPPFWIIPFLFMTSISVLTILILCTNFLFSIGATVNYRFSLLSGNSNSGTGSLNSINISNPGLMTNNSNIIIANSLNSINGLVTSSGISNLNNSNSSSNIIGGGNTTNGMNNIIVNSSGGGLTNGGNPILANVSNAAIGGNGIIVNSGNGGSGSAINSNIGGNNNGNNGNNIGNINNGNGNNINSNGGISIINGNINSSIAGNSNLTNIVNSNGVGVDSTKFYIGNFQLSFSKWIIVFIFLVLVIHSALGLIAFLLFLLFSPSTVPSNGLNSPTLSSSTASSNGNGKKKSNTNNHKSKDLLNYRQSIFLMYIFSAIIMVPNLIIWIKHLSFEWQIFDSYELFILFSITHICLSTIELTLNHLYILRVCLVIASFLVLVYCVLLIYRMLYLTLILSAIFMICHIYSKLKEKYL
ncbi:hypothetical protein CYY_009174 [Polysphondylium violaceum]|uniref:GPI inositol-deacylase n=1 Tax=Polysphondylium violaceum TaxID=133409 RepID=A0A8J4PKL2_9MYCE|nr:hypothetical protein CYY_009174 [Polysphondylium violaceum]